MSTTTGTRVSARGLLWDVLDRQALGAHDRLRLRCLSDDLHGLEWDFLHPHEPVEPLHTDLQPDRPGPLAAWLLYHEACLLDQIPGPTGIMIAQPGRVNIEPYQLVPLMRALSLPRARLLLADGVGLGKTIEAGLIAAEWIARRRAHRILIAAPAGPLLRQWEQEMRHRFGLGFTVLADAGALRDARRRLELGGNPFSHASFVLTSLDFAKQEPVLEELERASWDLAIIDEAHHCVSATTTTSRDDTQRRRLAEVIARQSDGLLLLTATPHDGYEPHFASLIELLDPSLVDGHGGLDGQSYRNHVVRRLKSHITDPVTGLPLFRDRRVVPIPIQTEDPGVKRFHRALALLVEPRLSKATQSKAFSDALAFVSLLKRSVSTIAACVATLQVVADRYAALSDASETAAARRDRQRTLRAYRRQALRFGVLDSRSESDLERLEAEDIAADLRASGDMAAALRHLIQLGEAARAEDTKLTALVTEIRLIRAAEPDANVLVYTEYADSQAEAAAALREKFGEVLTIGGQDTEAARTQAAERCATEDGLILISTDSLAEGLNLQQRCHHLIHLDLPYNPNRLEQRNGRIDRYGQLLDPEIRYLCLAGTFEERLLLRLIAKYEKARAQLTFMPDTLGMTVPEDRLGHGLLMGLAEEQASLFPDDAPPLPSMSTAADERGTEAYRDLLHEIDRAYEGFDRLAARHGWFAGQGMNASAAQLAEATSARHAAARDAARITLTGFVTQANGGPPTEPIGRVHPTVRQAIGRIRREGDNRVAAARGERLALLLTYSIEIQWGRHIALRQPVAILLPHEGAAHVIEDPAAWLELAAPTQTINIASPWAHFAAWVPGRLAEAEAALSTAVRALAEACIQRHAQTELTERLQLDRWLERRTTALCGPARIAVPDLFGALPPGLGWAYAAHPAERLSGFATDSEVSADKRREGEALLAIYHRRLRAHSPLSEPTTHPIGMLMLVPA